MHVWLNWMDRTLCVLRAQQWERVTTMVKFLVIALVAALGAIALRNALPDIRRYQKISTM